ncbi:hypothetical protein VTO42DRAFT_1388 [Malbranchea cinnamomea]
MEGTTLTPRLEQIDPANPPNFKNPVKEIHNADDVSAFLTTRAYKDIMTFILQLNRAMFPSKVVEDGVQKVQPWPLGCDNVEFSEPVRRLQLLLERVESIIDEVPPCTGPRRFGNIAFRKWHEELEKRIDGLFEECIPSRVLDTKGSDPESASAKAELIPYFLGGLGSSQRLDYGTGHELSFLAFLAGIWKLNGFAGADPGVEERGIVLGIIEPYLKLIRRLIMTYTLEPAGSHGVWGLDDHSFIPYIFGSAQLSPAISESDPTPTEGSLANAPDPGDVSKANIVARERQANMYFSAIGFIYDVKRGPFWEHSPMLYDISGIRDGWGKINKGMIKMYNAEVLSKFPVVQHFPFGSLFRWEPHPDLVRQSSTAVHSTQSATRQQPPALSGLDTGTKAPWATAGSVSTSTQMSGRAPPPPAPTAFPGTTKAPWATGSTGAPPSGWTPTQAPWATGRPAADTPDSNLPTKAPWADKQGDGK